MTTFNPHLELQGEKEAIITLANQLQCHDNYEALKESIELAFYEELVNIRPGIDWMLKEVTPGMSVLHLDPNQHVSSGIYKVASTPEFGPDEPEFNEPQNDDCTIGLSSDTSSLESFKSELYMAPVKDIDYLYAAAFARKLQILSVTGISTPDIKDNEGAIPIHYFKTSIVMQAFERTFSFTISIVECDNDRTLQSIFDFDDGRLLLDDEDECIMDALLIAINRLHEDLDKPEIKLNESQVAHIISAFC